MSETRSGSSPVYSGTWPSSGYMVCLSKSVLTILILQKLLFREDVYKFSSVQFSSVAQSCLTLCDPINCSVPGLPVHHQLLEFTQTHVHRVGDADFLILVVSFSVIILIANICLAPAVCPELILKTYIKTLTLIL